MLGTKRLCNSEVKALKSYLALLMHCVELRTLFWPMVAEWSTWFGGTGNPVLSSRARAGVLCYREGRALDGRGSWLLWMRWTGTWTGGKGCHQVCSAVKWVGQTWWQGRRPYPLQKGHTRLSGVLEVTPWIERTLHRDYCKEQPVISQPRWDRAIVFNWGGFKLSPEVRWPKHRR
jgi:hypothetical protein